MKPILQQFALQCRILLLSAGLAGCNRGEPSASLGIVSNASPIVVEAEAEVRSITLPHYEPDMPEAPGRAEFLQACIICHSPRYVTTQPPFPRKTWEEIVGKMVKTYGAHADEEQMRRIIDYVTSINNRGDEEHPL